MRILCVLLVALTGSEALLQQLFDTLNMRSEILAADPSPHASRLARKTAAIAGKSGTPVTFSEVSAGVNGTVNQSLGQVGTVSDTLGSNGTVTASSGEVGTLGAVSDVPLTSNPTVSQSSGINGAGIVAPGVAVGNDETLAQGAALVGTPGISDVSEVSAGSEGTLVQSIEKAGTHSTHDASTNNGTVLQSSGNVGTPKTYNGSVASSVGDAQIPTTPSIASNPLGDDKPAVVAAAERVENADFSVDSPTGSTTEKSSGQITSFDLKPDVGSQQVGVETATAMSEDTKIVGVRSSQKDSQTPGSGAVKPMESASTDSVGRVENDTMQGSSQPLEGAATTDVFKSTRHDSSVVMKITTRPPKSDLLAVTKRPTLKEKSELRKAQKNNDATQIGSNQFQSDNRQVPLQNFKDDDFFDTQSAKPKVTEPEVMETLTTNLQSNMGNLGNENAAMQIITTEKPNLPTVRYPHSPSAAENTAGQITPQIIAETLSLTTTAPTTRNIQELSDKAPDESLTSLNLGSSQNTSLSDKIQPVNNRSDGATEAQKPPDTVGKNNPTVEGVEKQASPPVDEGADSMKGALQGLASNATHIKEEEEEEDKPRGADDAIVNSPLNEQKPGAEIGVNGDIVGTTHPHQPSLSLPVEKPYFPGGHQFPGVGSLKCRLVPTLGVRLLTPVTKADLCAHLLRYECESPLAKYCSRRVSRLPLMHNHYHVFEHKLWTPGSVYQPETLPHHPTYESLHTPVGISPWSSDGGQYNSPSNDYSHHVSSYEVQNQYIGPYSPHSTTYSQNNKDSMAINLHQSNYGAPYDGKNYLSNQGSYVPSDYEQGYEDSNYQDGVGIHTPSGEFGNTSPIVSPFANIQSPQPSQNVAPNYPYMQSQISPKDQSSSQNFEQSNYADQNFRGAAGVQPSVNRGNLSPALSPFSSRRQRKRRARDPMPSSTSPPGAILGADSRIEDYGARFQRRIGPSSMPKYTGESRNLPVSVPKSEISKTLLIKDGTRNPKGVVKQEKVGENLLAEPPKNLNPLSDDPNDPAFLEIQKSSPRKRALVGSKRRKLLRLLRMRRHRIKKHLNSIEMPDDFGSTSPLDSDSDEFIPPDLEYIEDSEEFIPSDEDRPTRCLRKHRHKTLPVAWERTYPLDISTVRGVSPYLTKNEMSLQSSYPVYSRHSSLAMPLQPYQAQPFLPETISFSDPNLFYPYSTGIQGSVADPDFVSLKVAAIIDSILSSILQHKPTVSFGMEKKRLPHLSSHSYRAGLNDLKFDMGKPCGHRNDRLLHEEFLNPNQKLQGLPISREPPFEPSNAHPFAADPSSYLPLEMYQQSVSEAQNQPRTKGVAAEEPQMTPARFLVEKTAPNVFEIRRQEPLVITHKADPYEMHYQANH